MPRPRAALAAALANALLLLAAPGARADAADDAVRTRLLSDLSAEVASVRERALERLAGMDELAPAELVAACRAASPRAKPLFFRLAATRRVQELVPDIAAAAASRDAPGAEAAMRSLVALGDDAVAAAKRALTDTKDGALAEGERETRLRHLAALHVQHRVERLVLSKWRRKGGSYRGRFKDLAAYGWEAQPVLLAMLLDVPVEDQFLVVPTVGEPNADADARREAIDDLGKSTRRGYRTFEPLPVAIEPDELFNLAEQALVDVGDLEVLGGVLKRTHAELVRVDREAGFLPRRFEESFATAIEVILAAHGDRGLLVRSRMKLEAEALMWRKRASRWEADEDPRTHSMLATTLDELAGVLHQLGEFDVAASRYAEAIAVRKALTGKIASFSAYNRACALARAGRGEEALDELERALDQDLSTGSEDFTPEWVREDGDLGTLRGSPRFEAIVKRRFPAAAAESAPREKP